MRGDGKALLGTIRDEKALSDESEKKLVEALDSFAAGFTALTRTSRILRPRSVGTEERLAAWRA